MKTVLEGKKILLTRPTEQYEEWAARLLAYGSIPISFPLIEIEAVNINPQIRNILERLSQFDWIVFTSANAAKYFFSLIQSENIHTAMPAIAAVGAKTAAYIENAGHGVDFMPGIYTSAQLSESMPGIAGKKILLPRTNLADDELLAGLTNRGAQVDEIIIYHTRKIIGSAVALQSLINTGLDVITFASPSAVEAFMETGADKKDALIACIGPVTGKRAVELGLEPDIVAEKYTTDGLTQAIRVYYERHKA